MENDNVEEVFPGFWHPDVYQVGFTKMPHELIQELHKIDSIAELKVILYVMRHTWGFQEFDQWKRITFEEFMHGRNGLDNGTGLTKQSVIAGLEKAIDHGFLLCKTIDRDKARIKKFYKLKLRQESDV